MLLNSKMKVLAQDFGCKIGTDPIRDSVLMPLYEDNVGTTKWIKGACFPSMGKDTSINL